jgi:hypothetical protein
MGQGVAKLVGDSPLKRGFKAPERRVPLLPQFRGEAGRSEVNTFDRPAAPIRALQRDQS